MAVSVKYKGEVITTFENSKTLSVKGKYCEDNLIINRGNGLPEAYREVEYLQSSGTQYINTGLTVKSKDRIFKTKYQHDTSSSAHGLFGNANSEDGIHTRFSRINSSFEWDCYKGKNYGRVVYSLTNTGAIEELELGNNYIKDLSTNTVLVTGTSADYTNTNLPIYLFGYLYNTGYISMAPFKLYYFKVYDSGTLVRNFIPCYRISDSVAGLYDLAEGNFYTNAGTGSFIVGGNV